jgi:addiction module HigA family antidote
MTDRDRPDKESPTVASEETHGIPVSVRTKEDGTIEVDTSAWDAHCDALRNASNAEVNPALLAFFKQAFALLDLSDQRREAQAACKALWLEAKAAGTLGVVHPGVLLQRDFLGRPGIDRDYLSYRLDLAYSKLDRLLAGDAAITPTTAEKLSALFDLPAAFWIGLQDQHDSAPPET